MSLTVRDALVNALEELEEKDLKKFCNKIRDTPIKSGFSRIPLSKLEKKDAEEVATIIKDYYRDMYGAQLTVAVLNAINQKKKASELEDNLVKVPGFGYQKTQEEEPPTEGAPSGPTKSHFVDKHREDLIQRVTLVSSVLDSLFSINLLTQEQYDRILVGDVSQEKMRRLYSAIHGWGEPDKDKLYEAIKKHNPPLITDLEQKEAQMAHAQEAN